MPMNFPDMKSLEEYADMIKFRVRSPEESEEQYRTILADHVASEGRHLESMEIRSGKGWDQFTDDENDQVLCQAAGVKDITHLFGLPSNWVMKP